MSAIGDFVGDVVGGITGAKQASEAGERAGDLQYAAAQQGVAEQRRQFDALVELMTPFVAAGESAISQQQNLLGLSGPEAQAAALRSLEDSPEVGALLKTGEEAILQNASATGGLRGGNVQQALMEYRPQVLSQAIQNQYSRLGGLSQLGQASAAGQASAGVQTGSNVANLLQQGGAAQAGKALAQGSLTRQAFGDVLGIAQTLSSGGIF